jgi:hypothetical protein
MGKCGVQIDERRSEIDTAKQKAGEKDNIGMLFVL